MADEMKHVHQTGMARILCLTKEKLRNKFYGSYEKTLKKCKNLKF